MHEVPKQLATRDDQKSLHPSQISFHSDNSNQPENRIHTLSISIEFDARVDLTDLCVRWACKSTHFPLGDLRTRGTFNELIMIFRHFIF